VQCPDHPLDADTAAESSGANQELSRTVAECI